MKNLISKDPTFWIITHDILGWTITSSDAGCSIAISEKQALWAVKASQRASKLYNHFTATGGKWGLALI